MMSRFRKGTLDHDNDGRKGGSLKETDMAKPTTKTARKPKAAPKPTAVEVAQTEAATTMDPQTGMDVVHAEKPAKAAIAKQFAEADRKADPAQEAIDEATISRSIRGW